MTSAERVVAGVIAALFAPAARLYEMKAAFGVVSDCVAFATTMEVMMATTVAMRMTPGRENFWIRILIAFILFGLLCFGRLQRPVLPPSPRLGRAKGKSFLAVHWWYCRK